MIAPSGGQGTAVMMCLFAGKAKQESCLMGAEMLRIALAAKSSI
jgi:hypothetical protein